MSMNIDDILAKYPDILNHDYGLLQRGEENE